MGDTAYNAVYVGIKNKSNVISQNGELLSAEELQRILADVLQPEKALPVWREDRVFPSGRADQ